MKYSDLAAAAEILRKNPPAFAVSKEREKALLRLDELFCEEDSENSRVLSRFFRERTDAALDEIAAYRGRTPRLWKLYSSGCIIKSAARTIAIDVNFGCARSQSRTRLELRPAQLRHIAKLIDEYYVTHFHNDHLSVVLCDALSRQRKLIVMPREAIHSWIVSGAVPAEEFRAKNCRVFMSCQKVPNEEYPCAMYLHTLANGRTLMVRGDIYHREGFEGCVAHLHEWGQPVDYAATSPFATSGRDPVEALGTEFDCRFIPIHEWEFGHRPLGKGGKATQTYAELYERFGKYYRRNRAQLLAWGESIDLA